MTDRTYLEAVRALVESDHSGGDPLVSLVSASHLRDAVDDYIYASLVAQRKAGTTWDDLAAALGMTRQGATAIVKRRQAM